MARTMKISIASEQTNVSLVGLAVNRISYHMGFSSQDAHQIEIGVVEAVHNAIRHSHKNDPSLVVEVILDVFEDYLLIRVRDFGLSMGRLKIPDLDFDPDDLNNIPESGMGLFIINKIMDDVKYESKDGFNQLVMTKYLHGLPDSGA